MKIELVTPVNLNSEPLISGLMSLGHTVAVSRADRYLDGADVKVFMGAMDAPWLNDDGFFGLKARVYTPAVLVVPEASSPDWHPLLQKFVDEKIFDVVVNIDGGLDWPGARSGVTLLPPIDPGPYGYPRPWETRPVGLGFAGGTGSGHRRELLEELKDVVVIRKQDDVDGTYPAYARWLRGCRAVLNLPLDGPGHVMHVKARVIECGLAGAVLLEHADSPTWNYFRLGVHGLAYRTASDARSIIRELEAHQEEYAPIAWALWHEVTTKHSPKVFWGKVFEAVRALQRWQDWKY